MNVSTDKHFGINHSQFYWLLIPILAFWLVINYVIGQLNSTPAWRQTQALGGSQEVLPYQPKFADISLDGKGLITLWFDDAWSSQYFAAAPVLRQHGFHAAIAVPTGSVGYDAYVNWAQLRALQQDGWEITNHSVSHDCQMQNWTREQLSAELAKASQDLWRHQLSSDHFVTPCGVSSDTLKDVARSEFVSYRTVEPGENDLNSLDPYDLKVQNVTNTTTLAEMKSWVDRAVSDNKWQILVFHQVGEEGALADNQETYNIRLQDFKDLIDYIKQSGVQVVTPSQAINAREI